MRKIQFIACFIAFTTSVCYTSCTESPEPETENITPPGNDGDPDDQTTTRRGLFIINEGNFMYENASLSYYDIDSKQVENNVYHRVNGALLGDVAQSASISGDNVFIAVNNSNVVRVIDKNTFKSVGKIPELQSPANIHFINDEKAYITDLYAFDIVIFNPKTFDKIGRIEGSSDGPKQQTAETVNPLYTNCWTYTNKVLVVDTENDKWINEIEIGSHPTSSVVDKYGKLWTITDGGYPGSPTGYTPPALYRIDVQTGQVEKEFEFNLGDVASKVCLNGAKDTLYFINNDIWQMPVTAETLPEKSFIPNNNETVYYGLTVDPKTSEIYIADAIDYSQRGMIYRYNPQGEQVDAFRVGVIPSGFCFKE